MADWIYVDNSNVFIEGKRVSAVKLGLAPNIWDAFEYRILDNDYRMSFGKLYEFVAGNNRADTARAMLFGSRPPINDAIWDIAKKAGWEVITHDRNFSNKEKKIDTGITAALTRDAYKNAQAGDIFTIVSGDNDYVPAVEQLREDGFQVDVVFWDHAGKELRDIASNFISLNNHLDTLRM
ncbi:NYN domain-containing protein [Rhizobium sp. PP-F2F-G38]|nr:NYN domain-containing protein [Rhizobium sp. PP-WC-1G-195]PYE92712.1 NYN domain-containing protein [Rhizobium sp. PP-F2F-G38]TCP77233.1 NYN domain-containing protein [Rhizobium sp. PP-CC-2G-626]